jgi:hypothetical protein
VLASLHLKSHCPIVILFAGDITPEQAAGGVDLMRACLPIMILGVVEEETLLSACRGRGRVDDVFALLAQLLLDVHNQGLREIKMAVRNAYPTSHIFGNSYPTPHILDTSS